MPRFDDVRRPEKTATQEAHVRTQTVVRPCARKDRSDAWRLSASLSALLLAGAVSVAHAELAPSSSDATPPAATPAPKTTDRATSSDAEASPQHIAKARRLILATGISRSFQIIIPEFMDQIGNTLTQSKPELVPDMTAVLTALRPEFEKQSDEMIDQSARIYAGLLSEKDIDAILTFFDSDAGKKYVGAQPFFLNQLVSGMQAWQQKISTNMMARVRQEMKKKGHEL